MFELILNNIAGEFVLLIILLISVPFAALQIFIGKKTDKIKSTGQVPFNFNKKKLHIISLISAILVCTGVGLIMGLGFEVDIFNDFIILILLATFIGTFMTVEIIAMLIYYLKLKKLKMNDNE